MPSNKCCSQRWQIMIRIWKGFIKGNKYNDFAREKSVEYLKSNINVDMRKEQKNDDLIHGNNICEYKKIIPMWNSPILHRFLFLHWSQSHFSRCRTHYHCLSVDAKHIFISVSIYRYECFNLCVSLYKTHFIYRLLHNTSQFLWLFVDKKHISITVLICW